jgi:hypothetical protein
MEGRPDVANKLVRTSARNSSPSICARLLEIIVIPDPESESEVGDGQ